jgi:hypothetical protein
MATPIKATPVLQGNSSKRFNLLLQSKTHVRVSPEEKNKIFSLVEKVLTKKKQK